MAKEDKEDRKNARKAKKEARISARKNERKADDEPSKGALKNVVDGQNKSEVFDKLGSRGGGTPSITSGLSKTEKRRKERQDSRKDKSEPSFAEQPAFDKLGKGQPDISGNKDIGGEISKNIIRKSPGMNEAIEESKTGDKAKTVEEATKEIVKDVDDKESKLKKTLEIIKPEGGTRTTDEGYKKYDGDGSTLGDAARDGDGKYDAYNMSDQDFERSKREYQEDYASQRASAPEAAIELMGIEHYYPPQEDFIKSNFTGRYIGSRTLVSPTGALYPESLIDARERAKEAKAKAKAVSDEKFWDLTSTAPQYDEHYKDIGMDLMDKYGDASGWDFDALSKSGSKLGKQFRRDLHDYESRGKNILEVSNLVNTMLAAAEADAKIYYPPEILSMMQDVRTASDGANFDAYMRGEKGGDEKMQGITNMIRSYKSFTPLMDDRLKIMSTMGMDIDLIAPGADFDDPTFAENAKSAISLNETKHWKEYRTSMMKHYNVDRAMDIVTGIYEQNSLWEGTSPEERDKIIQASTKSFIAHLPEQISVAQKFVDTKAMDEMNFRQRQYEFSKKKDWTERDFTNLYDDAHTEFSDPEFRADMLQAENDVKPSTGTTADDARYKREIMASQKSVLVKHKHDINDNRGYITSIISTPGDMVGTVQSKGNATKIWGPDGTATTVGRRITKLRKEAAIGGGNFTDKDQEELDDLVHIQSRDGESFRYNATSTEVSDWIYLPSEGFAVPASDPRATPFLGDKDKQVEQLERSGSFRMPTIIDKDGEQQYRKSVVQLVEGVNLGSEKNRRGAAGSIKEREGLRTGKGTKGGEPSSGTSTSTGSGG